MTNSGSVQILSNNTFHQTENGSAKKSERKKKRMSNCETEGAPLSENMNNTNELEEKKSKKGKKRKSEGVLGDTSLHSDTKCDDDDKMSAKMHPGTPCRDDFVEAPERKKKKKKKRDFENVNTNPATLVNNNNNNNNGIESLKSPDSAMKCTSQLSSHSIDGDTKLTRKKKKKKRKHLETIDAKPINSVDDNREVSDISGIKKECNVIDSSSVSIDGGSQVFEKKRKKKKKHLERVEANAIKCVDESREVSDILSIKNECNVLDSSFITVNGGSQVVEKKKKKKKKDLETTETNPNKSLNATGEAGGVQNIKKEYNELEVRSVAADGDSDGTRKKKKKKKTSLETMEANPIKSLDAPEEVISTLPNVKNESLASDTSSLSAEFSAESCSKKKKKRKDHVQMVNASPLKCNDVFEELRNVSNITALNESSVLIDGDNVVSKKKTKKKKHLEVEDRNTDQPVDDLNGINSISKIKMESTAHDDSFVTINIDHEVNQKRKKKKKKRPETANASPLKSVFDNNDLSNAANVEDNRVRSEVSSSVEIDTENNQKEVKKKKWSLETANLITIDADTHRAQIGGSLGSISEGSLSESPPIERNEVKTELETSINSTAGSIDPIAERSSGDALHDSGTSSNDSDEEISEQNKERVRPPLVEVINDSLTTPESRPNFIDLTKKISRIAKVCAANKRYETKHPLLVQWHASRKQLRDAGVVFAEGRWTKVEVDALRANIVRYARNYSISNFEKYYQKVVDGDGDSPKDLYLELGENIYRPLKAIRDKMRTIYRTNEDEQPAETNKWTPEEVDELLRLQKIHGNDWPKIGKMMNKTKDQLKRKFSALKLRLAYGKGITPLEPDSETTRSRKKYTEEEDDKLRNAIEEHGKFVDGVLNPHETNWHAVSRSLDGRDYKSCYQRWKFYISKSLNQDLRQRKRLFLDCVKLIYDSSIDDMGEVDWNALSTSLDGETDPLWLQKLFHNYMQGADARYKHTTDFRKMLRFILQDQCSLESQRTGLGSTISL